MILGDDEGSLNSEAGEAIEEEMMVWLEMHEGLYDMNHHDTDVAESAAPEGDGSGPESGDRDAAGSDITGSFTDATSAMWDHLQKNMDTMTESIGMSNFSFESLTNTYFTSEGDGDCEGDNDNGQEQGAKKNTNARSSPTSTAVIPTDGQDAATTTTTTAPAPISTQSTDTSAISLSSTSFCGDDSRDGGRSSVGIEFAAATGGTSVSSVSSSVSPSALTPPTPTSSRVLPNYTPSPETDQTPRISTTSRKKFQRKCNNNSNSSGKSSSNSTSCTSKTASTSRASTSESSNVASTSHHSNGVPKLSFHIVPMPPKRRFPSRMKSAPNPQHRDEDRGRGREIVKDRDSSKDHHGLPTLHPKDAPTRNRNKYKHLIRDLDLSVEHDDDGPDFIERDNDNENESETAPVSISSSHEKGSQMRQSQLCKLQSSHGVTSVFIPRVVAGSSDEFDNNDHYLNHSQHDPKENEGGTKELSWDLPKPTPRRRHASDGHGHGHSRHGRLPRRQKRCSTKQALSAFAVKPTRQSIRSRSTSKTRRCGNSMDRTIHSYGEPRQCAMDEMMEQLHISRDSQQPRFKPQALSFDIPLSDILSIERDTVTQNPATSSLDASNTRGRRNSLMNIGVLHIYYKTPSSDLNTNAESDENYTTSYLQLKPDTIHGRDLLLAFLRASKLKSEAWRKIASHTSMSIYPTLQLSALIDTTAAAAETTTSATSIDPRFVIDLEITDRLEELRKELKFESENKDEDGTTMDPSTNSQTKGSNGSPMSERKKAQQLELQQLQERRRRRSIGHKVFSERTKKLLVDEADCNTPNARPTSSSSSTAEVDMQHFEDRAVKSRFANETFIERWMRRSTRFVHRLDESKLPHRMMTGHCFCMM